MAILQNTNFLGTGPTLSLPSGTTAQRPALPTEGMIRYNTDLSFAEIFINNGWQNIREGTANTLCYIPLYGDTASSQDITCQISGVQGTISGTTTRNNLVGSYTGLYVNQGCLDFMNHQMERLSGSKYWTVEWYSNYTGGTGTASTQLEMTKYTTGLLYRSDSAGLTTNSYWRGAAITLGAYGSTGVWHHYAICGNGPNIQVFIDGVSVANTMNAVGTSAFADPFPQNDTNSQGQFNKLRIGSSSHVDNVTSQYCIGTFRKFRVSSVLRYAAAFTPSAVYPI